MTCIRGKRSTSPTPSPSPRCTGRRAWCPRRRRGRVGWCPCCRPWLLRSPNCGSRRATRRRVGVHPGRWGGHPARDDTLAWKQLCVQAAVVGKVEDAPDQHAARHTVATLLQEAGVEEATRMAILGHTTTTSHRQYAHTSTDLTRAALGQLEKLLALPDV
nr:tyrosine-type recombinase/integrase [Gordonia westfalica]